MIYIGIDVGKKGAIAYVSSMEGAFSGVYPQPLIRGKWPDEQRMKEHLLEIRALSDKPMFACIEKAQAMPKQGVTSMFSYGKLFGVWCGLLVMAGIPREEVPPRKWQNVMLSGVDKSDTKAASILVARRLFPNVSLRPTPKCCKYSDGMADALNMAAYARQQYLGAQNAE